MSPMVALAAPVLSSLIVPRMPRLLFVCCCCQYFELNRADISIAKFTGYQYGGRPLGLTYVKYMSAGNGDAMEGAEPTGGMTQDQIM